MRERTIYWIVAGVLGVLLIVMLVGWNYDRQNDEANAKAAELIAAFEDGRASGPGSRIRSRGRSATTAARSARRRTASSCRATGSSGSWSAASSTSAPSGSTGGSARGLSLVVDVYCPEKRPDIEDFFEDWDFDDTIRD